MKPPRPTLRNWISITALGLIWGGTFMVVVLALRGYGPVTVAAARTTLGTLALLGMVLIWRKSWPTWSPTLWFYIVCTGILSSALPFFLLSWGQQFVPSAFAGLSMATLPLFVLPLAHVFLPDERLMWHRTLGFGLGFVGALVLLAPDLSGGASGDQTLARLACLAAALCYACASILTRKCPPIDSTVLSMLTLAVGTAVLLPAMILTEGIPAVAPMTPTLSVLLLGLVPTGFAALLRTHTIRTAGPGFMTLTNYQVPLWSMVFGVLILGETLPGRFFIALGLILTGLLISQWRAFGSPS
ncbi:MAG: DMT family transporter [Pseudomonadota bacterium]